MSPDLLEKFFLGAGVLTLIIGAVFAIFGIDVAYRNLSSVAHAGAACGFSIAGGLSFLSAAILHRRSPGA